MHTVAEKRADWHVNGTWCEKYLSHSLFCKRYKNSHSTKIQSFLFRNKNQAVYYTLYWWHFIEESCQSRKLEPNFITFFQQNTTQNNNGYEVVLSFIIPFFTVFDYLTHMTILVNEKVDVFFYRNSCTKKCWAAKCTRTVFWWRSDNTFRKS